MKTLYSSLFAILCLLLIPCATRTIYSQTPTPTPRVEKLLYDTGFCDGRIVVVNEDGTGKKELTPTGQSDAKAVWSPDGTKIAFVALNFSTGYNQLYVMNADGTGRRRLTTSTVRDESVNYIPAWSPDSQKIVWNSSGPNTAGGNDEDLFVINVDGTGLTNLTRTPDQQERDPQWSPDGQKILFSSSPLGANEELYVMNTDGTGRTKISGGQSCVGAKWSPDGTLIAAVCVGEDPDGSGLDYNTIGVGGASGGMAMVTESRYRNASLQWSHDSSRIIFESSRWDPLTYQTVSRIYTVNATGGGAEPFSLFGKSFPIYSPDDTKIAYLNDRSFYVAKEDGNNRRYVTSDRTCVSQPSWQPRQPCECNAFPKPASQSIQTNWPDPKTNWSMKAQVTDTDGLALTDIKLGSRYLAEKISLPYVRLETSEFSDSRLELKPNNTEINMRSRLINYEVTQNDEQLVIEATYVIDQIPVSSKSCLYVVQRYEFNREGVGGRCEPSGTLPCSRWKPIVKYRFYGRVSQFLKSFTAAQRQHYRIDNYARNSVGLFKDSDSRLGAFANFGFDRKANPLFDEMYAKVVGAGRDRGFWDNFHQTYAGYVDEPGISVGLSPEFHLIGFGCPECLHSHWRWGAFQGPFFGEGNILGIPKGSIQDLTMAVVKNNINEEDPYDVVYLANNERIRHPATGYDPTEQMYDYTAPDDVVFWYAGTGYQNGDTFFGHAGSFSSSAPQRRLIGPPAAPSAAATAPDSAFVTTTSTQDELTSVTAANLYVDGATTATAFDPNVIGPLPQGYTVYNNLVYDVQTEAVISGPHTTAFSVASVTDQTVFNNLRIFHAEQDPFDVDKAVWVDRTIMAPDPLAPNFASKSINARSNLLGPFVVASLTGTPPNTGAADLAVTMTDSPGQLTAGSNLTYTISVTNSGPQAATGVRMVDPLPPNSEFVSALPSQGTCTEIEGRVACKLAALNAGAGATVTITVKMTEGGLTIPIGGTAVSNTAYVRADASDPNSANNSATESTILLPDSNRAPTVKITGPATGAMFVGPANITVTAEALDSDGVISTVDFFDNGELIGSGTATGQNQYSLNWNNVPFGTHSLIAVASDGSGKKTNSTAASITVNGTASVVVTTPAPGSVYASPASITVNANASQIDGSISKVDFYANDALIGTGAVTGQNQYGVTWSNVTSGSYLLYAVAFDGNGVATTSQAVPVSVYVKAPNTPPTITIASPATGASFNAPSNVVVLANVWDAQWPVSKVDFYANGILLGPGGLTSDSQYAFIWNNVARGSYALTAVVTDSDGVTVTSSAVNIKVTSPALLVTGSTTLNSSETAIKNRLGTLGYTVTVKDGATATSADATGKAVVVISSTVTPTSVGTKFRSVAVPVVTWESGLFYNMGMTANTNGSFGTTTKQTQVKIINSSHPLAASLSGTVTVVTASGTFDWGVPNSNAVKVATLAADTTKYVIFGYESGAAMPGLSAPARRVGLFMYDTTAATFNTNGWALFDAAINWAAGLSPLAENIGAPQPRGWPVFTAGGRNPLPIPDRGGRILAAPLTSPLSWPWSVPRPLASEG